MLACSDPGEDEKLGGLLVGSYGRGLYAYCGYTLFRQLPAGVHGAFRLFSNLLALPEARIRRRMECLREVSLFAELDDVELHRVAEIATERRLAKDEYLFHEGDEGTDLYVIETGSLDVIRGGPTGRQVPARCADRRARGLHGSPAEGIAESVRRDAALRHPHPMISCRSFVEDPDLGERMIRLLAGRLSVALEAASTPAEDPIIKAYE